MRKPSVKDGVITFRWTNPEGLDTDTFLWRVVGSGSAGTEVSATSVDVPAESDGVTCIEVTVLRDGVQSLSAQRCEEALP
jgi:hypothetical protein